MRWSPDPPGLGRGSLFPSPIYDKQALTRVRIFQTVLTKASGGLGRERGPGGLAIANLEQWKVVGLLLFMLRYSEWRAKG